MEVGRSWKAEQLFVGFILAVFKFGETSIKVARLDFSGLIPPKFEH